MKLKISTEVFKEMMSRAMKGVGNLKGSPITTMICIELKNNTLKLITTDEMNYLYVKKSQVEGDDFYIVVYADQLYKLISKQTCDSIEMEVKENFLEVRGNGTYHIDIPLDDGEFTTYIDPVEEMTLDDDECIEVNLTDIHTVLEACKSSLADTLEVPCYTGYYIGESVVTTNNLTMCAFDKNLFGQNVLVAREFLDLLDVMTVEKFSVHIQDDIIVAISPDCVVYGHLMEDIEEYPVEAIKRYVSQDMESNVVVNRLELLAVLDRIALFVGPYDDDAINFTFAEDGLSIESRQSSGIEVIPYVEKKVQKPFTGVIYINQLMKAIKSYPDDNVHIWYGAEKAIKLSAGNLVFAIALLIEQQGE